GLASRLWGYYAARSFEDAVLQDDGCYIRDFFRAINAFGFLPEDRYPYNPEAFADHPPPTAMRRAFDQRAKGDAAYWRISSTDPDRLALMRIALAAGLPVVFGTDVSFDFASFSGFRVFDPPNTDDIAGGHAMTLAGFGWIGGQDTFTAVGSWGVSAHDAGYHHFSLFYAEQFSDIWVVEKAPSYSEV
ncbi:hypothetical protein KW797_00250, partial [Candidatus Parcubacteria bacterium]|nr:hypothetical protein [Candidatus Parcubacteria bacterium]